MSQRQLIWEACYRADSEKDKKARLDNNRWPLVFAQQRLSIGGATENYVLP